LNLVDGDLWIKSVSKAAALLLANESGLVAPRRLLCQSWQGSVACWRDLLERIPTGRPPIPLEEVDPIEETAPIYHGRYVPWRAEP
jgi:hypothetical protein